MRKGVWPPDSQDFEPSKESKSPFLSCGSNMHGKSRRQHMGQHSLNARHETSMIAVVFLCNCEWGWSKKGHGTCSAQSGTIITKQTYPNIETNMGLSKDWVPRNQVVLSCFSWKDYKISKGYTWLYITLGYPTFSKKPWGFWENQSAGSIAGLGPAEGSLSNGRAGRRRSPSVASLRIDHVVQWKTMVNAGIHLAYQEHWNATS